MSAFYQLHSSRLQYMGDMGRYYALRCILHKGFKSVAMCACFLLSGAQAQQLCRAVSEAACSLLTASWRSGDQAGVKAAFLPLSDIEGFSALASTANERQVAPSCFLWHPQSCCLDCPASCLASSVCVFCYTLCPSLVIVTASAN